MEFYFINKKLSQMKSTFLRRLESCFCALLVLGATSAFGQYCPQYTTTPTVNEFDWRTETFTAWIVDRTSGAPLEVTIPSPFYSNTAGILEQTANTWMLTEEGSNESDQPDFLPEDGWEVVSAALGSPDQPAPVPLLVLYNRYTGLLRVMMYVTHLGNGGDTYSAIKYAIEYSETAPFVDAALEGNVLPSKPMEAYSDREVRIIVPNEIVTRAPSPWTGFWIMSQALTNYDPCSCQYASKLRFAPKLHAEAELVLQLTGNGQVVQVFSSANSAGSQNAFLASVGSANDALGNLTKGAKFFKDVSALVDHYNAVSNNNTGGGNRNTPGGSGNNTTPNTTGNNGNSGSSNNAPPDLIPDWLAGALPWFGEIVHFIDLFAGGGAATPRPMEFNTFMSFTGAGGITISGPLENLAIPSPGDEPDAPQLIYNNPLGVIGLVDRIRLYYQDLSFDDEQGATTHLYFQQQRPVRVALNPASGLSIVEMRAYYRFKSKEPLNVLPPAGGTFVANLIRINDSLWRTPMLPLSCLPAYPIHAWNYREGEVLSEQKLPEVTFHLVARLRRNDYQPGMKDVFYSRMWEVEYVSESPTTPADAALALVPEEVFVPTLDDYLAQEPVAWNGVIITEPTSITPQNAQTIKSLGPGQVWVPVKHDPGNGGAPWVSLEPLGPSLEPGQTLPGGTRIRSLPACAQPVVPIGAAELADLCTDPDFYFPQNLGSAAWSGGRPDAAFKGPFRAFPNPASDRTTVFFRLLERQHVWLELQGVDGRRWAPLLDGVEMDAGEHFVELEVSDLARGTYVLRLKLEKVPEPWVIRLVKM